MIFGSVCSGIESASVAWKPLGWRSAFVSEIEAFPRGVLAHHYPEVPLHGDFTTIKENTYESIELLVGGTPCQSFSVAGLRKGLDDPRGNLTLGFLGLVERLRPRWVVWENVPGVLSDRTGAFGALLGGLAQLGYGFAYRVLDAQYFGVPQRRRRVFVVGYFGDWRRAAAVLFERASLRGDSPPRREAGKRFASGFECGPQGGGFTDLAPTLDSRCKEGPIRNQLGAGVMHGVIHQTVGALCADSHPGAYSGQDAYTGRLIPVGTFQNTGQGWWNDEPVAQSLRSSQGGGKKANIVAHSLRGEGFDASEDGTGRGVPIVPVAFPAELSGTQCAAAEDISPCLSRKHTTAIAFDPTQITSRENRSNPQPGDPRHTLAKGAHAPAVAQVQWASGGGKIENPTAQALRSGAEHNYQFLRVASAVRRLTPRECERLQGFPDDYTAIPWRGKAADQCPDGPRYKALGNSMAVPVMRWIGERIAAVDALVLGKKEAA